MKYVVLKTDTHLYETIASGNRVSSFDFKSKADEISHRASLCRHPYKSFVLFLSNKDSRRIPSE